MRRITLRRMALTALAALTVALLTATAVGADGNRHRKLLKANMSGAQEVPGPGDEDGRGKALVRVRPSAGQVCFALSWRNIADPTVAHIHEGEKGEAGPPVVTLFQGEATNRDCLEGLDEDLLRDIKRNPRDYYVNVHNSDFPDGAIRGQLKRTGFKRGFRTGVLGERRSHDRGDRDGECRKDDAKPER